MNPEDRKKIVREVVTAIVRASTHLEDAARNDFRESCEAVNTANKDMRTAERDYRAAKAKVTELEETMRVDSARLEQTTLANERMKALLRRLRDGLLTAPDTAEDLCDADFVSMVGRAGEVLRLHDEHGTGLPDGNSYAIGSEYAEFMEAMENGTEYDVASEYGDLLTNVLLTGLQMGLDPEKCAKLGMDKIVTRVTYIRNNCAISKGQPGYQREVVRLWKEAKSRE